MAIIWRGKHRRANRPRRRSPESLKRWKSRAGVRRLHRPAKNDGAAPETIRAFDACEKTTAKPRAAFEVIPKSYVEGYAAVSAFMAQACTLRRCSCGMFSLAIVRSEKIVLRMKCA